MNKKQIAVPFQEGFLLDGKEITHLFTDYRWNDGTVVRRWMVDAKQDDLATVVLRPFSPGDPDKPDQ